MVFGAMDKRMIVNGETRVHQEAAELFPKTHTHTHTERERER